MTPEHEEKTEEKNVKIDNDPDNNLSKIKEKTKNPWMIAAIVLGIVIIVLLFMLFRGGITGNVVSGEDASANLLEYLNGMTGGGVEYISFKDIGNLYEVTVDYENKEIPVYITKDGEYFVQGAIPLSGAANTNPNTAATQQPTEVPKSDKPEVELFVMTHCPYGTQAEKGFIPVLETLKDKIDGNIRFVHYFMHDPEEEETSRQICIREEQSAKYLTYLRCFLEEGDSEGCLNEAKIDKAKLKTCIDTKSEGYYASDSELSEGYGVSGSPTLVINGQIVNSGRSPAAFLSSICNAFNEAPEECSENLNSNTPSPMWGWDASSASDSAAQC